MKTPQDSTPSIPPATRAVTAAAIEQTCTLLRELGHIASAAMAVSRFANADLDEPDDLQSRMHALQLMVDRMGWVADVGLRTLGGEPMMARAEDWMLPDLRGV